LTSFEQLRVAHLLVHAEVDGIGLHVLDLARSQRNNGTVDPLIFTSASDEYGYLLSEAGVPAVRGRGLRFAPALRRYARLDFAGLGVDLVHLHGFRMSHLLPFLRMLRPEIRRLPIVATCHGLLQGTLRQRARTWLELQSYRWIRVLMTSSVEQAVAVSAVLPGLSVRYVPNGVSLPAGKADRAVDKVARPGAERDLRARFGFPADAELVAIIGRLAPEKRVDLFLEACRLIQIERPDAFFLVVGEGRERRALERLAFRCGLASRVRFTGMVNDVPELCEHVTLILHCADTEGTPRAVLHAMGAGVPVVARAVGGIPEMITDGAEGVLVSSADPRAMADRAVWLLTNSNERLVMGRRARHRVQSEFTIELMCTRVEEAYRYALMASEIDSTKATELIGE
jgi:glycosyltransferase involved in cell wall biosynthesis